jgi:hypothetical protein
LLIIVVSFCFLFVNVCNEVRRESYKHPLVKIATLAAAKKAVMYYVVVVSRRWFATPPRLDKDTLI